MESLSLLLSILILSSASEGIEEGGRVSPVTCSTNNTACDDTEDSHIEMIVGIKSIQECRQLCYDSNECEYLTYYGNEVCFLFRQYTETHSCTECVCYRYCGSNFVGKMDENVLEEIPAVESESDCRVHCRQKSNCRYFTLFQEDDPNSQTCVLEPLQQCDHCGCEK